MNKKGTKEAWDNLLGTSDEKVKPALNQSCSRRYSEVMQEYLKWQKRRGQSIWEGEEHNIKPSEVVTRHADKTGPNGKSYVSWAQPEFPDITSCVKKNTKTEESCVFHDIQKAHSTPCLYLSSPITPESGAESFATAKSHLSSSSATPSPSMRRSRVSLKIMSPSDKLQTIPKGTNNTQRCRTPLINVYSTGGSPTFHTFGHSSHEGDNTDNDTEGPSPTDSIKRFRQDSNSSLRNAELDEAEEHYFATAPPPLSSSNLMPRTLTPSNNTFIVKPKGSVTFEDPAMSDASVALNEACQADAHSNDIAVTLDFNRESCLESVSEASTFEQLEFSYPPDEKETKSYNLKSPHSWGSDGSTSLPWLSPREPGSRQQQIAQELRRLKCLKVMCWITFGAGLVLIILAVCLYFSLR